jgi:hypothetical protein
MKRQPNRWLLFSSLAIQMGVLFYGAVQLGAYLDTRFQSQNYATLACCTLALIISLYFIHKKSQQF